MRKLRTKYDKRFIRLNASNLSSSESKISLYKDGPTCDQVGHQFIAALNEKTPLNPIENNVLNLQSITLLGSRSGKKLSIVKKEPDRFGVCKGKNYDSVKMLSSN